MPGLAADLRDDARFAREPELLRAVVRLVVRVLVRAGVRVAFFALAICDRPLISRGGKDA